MTTDESHDRVAAAGQQLALAYLNLATAIVRSALPSTTSGGSERLTWTVQEVAASLGTTTRQVYSLIHSGKLAHIRAGKHYLVPTAEVTRFVSDVVVRDSDPPDVSVFGATDRSTKHHRNRSLRGRF
ncbi:excisionase family DNA-binding protein [Amycolatopsis azurea]|nr:helix-turn-helix domain-containing protein [Amycolatopsis azurea]